VKPTFAVLSGARAGVVVIPAGDRLVAGRHAEAELRFDPHADLTVSAQHAEIACTGGAWYVRDLQSSNGTYVDGARISAPTPLRDGSVITFGTDGPRVRFECSAAAPGQPESATQRMRAAVRREVRRIRIAAVAVLLVVLGLVGAVLVGDRREHAALDAERRQLRGQIDSLLAVGQAAESAVHGEVDGLRAALQESETRLRELRRQLAAAPTDRSGTSALEQQLLAAGTALRRQQLAANLDFPLIESRNRPAVVMIWVEYTDGRRVTGTAFAVRRDATLVTSRHLVTGQDGAAAVQRIAVRFADSEQVFPARVLAVSPSADLAVLKADNILGDVPVVHAADGAPSPIAAGSPVAFIGFPLGGATDAAGAQVARPLLSAGIVSDVSDGHLEVQGLGAAGASGSPILNAQGELVGVLYGGRLDAGVQTLFAVPAADVRALLNSLR
jgi:S1-C subfamily serine protease